MEEVWIQNRESLVTQILFPFEQGWTLPQLPLEREQTSQQLTIEQEQTPHEGENEGIQISFYVKYSTTTF